MAITTFSSQYSGVGHRATDGLQALSLLILAVAQIVSAQLPFMLGWPETVASQARAVETPLTPAGYSFAIWGVIYLWSLVFAIWQILPRQLHHPVVRRAGWPIAGAFAANTLWSWWVPQNGVDAVSFLIIAAGVTCACAAMLNLVRSEILLTRAEDTLMLMPVSLLAGWVSAAAFVNAASAVRLYGIDQLDPLRPDVAMGFLLTAMAFLLTLTRLGGQMFYALAGMWALQGIVAANLNRGEASMLNIVAGAGIALLAANLIWAKVRKPDEA
ncbi:hypothetical protein Q1W73_09955 [Asticcacaulis sp. ZE23SCel15]|uniref:hypothetical protein n=1 Tax=Asticcacaulis sp. ZE23SCel15 TaxID=3059027 RepID=UPI00265DF271|nr:hypothetical protein [Asticcacaulis sp. ZE23SCel15]WKL56024.1 hypothetical protein Q1W73_09955 [Asticcacaulis sp. ZE23SCel15]